MAVLAVPVLGSLSGDAMSRYEVTVKVKSIFPDDTKLALRALGTQVGIFCRAACTATSSATSV
jgi:hypothetical protein